MVAGDACFVSQEPKGQGGCRWAGTETLRQKDRRPWSLGESPFVRNADGENSSRVISQAKGQGTPMLSYGWFLGGSNVLASRRRRCLVRRDSLFRPSINA